jgi:uncharacterized membrane protein
MTDARTPDVPPTPQPDARSSHRPAAREPQVLLHDLTAELLWPRALRTPALALRPARVLLGMAAVFLATLIGNLSALWTDDDAASSETATAPLGDSFQATTDWTQSGTPTFADAIAIPLGRAMAAAARAVADLDPHAFTAAVRSLVMLPGYLITERPLDTALLGLPIVAVFALFGATISRGVATEFTAARITDWPNDLRTSAGKLAWSFSALIAPLAVAGLLIGVVILGGFTLGIPVVNILGALLYAVALILCVVALFILILHALALPMIVPALMCEGTDAYDAVQRSYAYIIARPLRLLAHAALLLILGAASIYIVGLVAQGAIQLTDWAASQLNSDAGVRVLDGRGELTATQPAAHAIIDGWRAVIQTVVAGFAFSYFFAAGTVLYLHARRICDGQGTADIWDPDAHPN